MTATLDIHYRQQKIDDIIAHPNEHWDVIIIGGGATGLGCALDAVSRGLKTILIEKGDIAEETSSKSTKLIHGGVRYLAQGNIALVREALKERGILTHNASHIVKKKKFIIPAYSFFSWIWYGVGLKVYDLLSGKWTLGKSEMLSRTEACSLLQGITTKGLVGAITYWDAQFDDSRLAVNVAQTIIEKGGIVLTYSSCNEFIYTEQGTIAGVKCVDVLSNKIFTIHSNLVINATGVHSNLLIEKSGAKIETQIKPSKGVHIVVDQKRLFLENAVLIPKTTDGRVLFAVPWYNKIVLGTTDTIEREITSHPPVLLQDIDFILHQCNPYLESSLSHNDIQAVFAGLRPLVVKGKNKEKTKEISRSHQIHFSSNGLLSITGGKWTTFRKMAEDTLQKAIDAGRLPVSTSITKNLVIHGNSMDNNDDNELWMYGADAEEIRKIQHLRPELARKIHPDLPYTFAEVVWSVHNELVCTLEDLLSRRLRCLFLNADATISIAEEVAQLMANELELDSNWVKEQVELFQIAASKFNVKSKFE